VAPFAFGDRSTGFGRTLGLASVARSLMRASVLLALPFAAPALAQWDPPLGQWGEQPSVDLRVMTWNVQDGLCSTNSKVEGLDNWCALARVVAALRPDVLILQETGDNSGNGTGSGVDSVPDLEKTVDLFLHGGTDPFQPGQPLVTAWVEKYAPSYDLPFEFVSAVTDGFNRNTVLSRYPFADLNGDGHSTLGDIPFLSSSAYATGPHGGIRGFQHVEIDLPDALYAGDLVLGNSHLKAGSGSSQMERLVAAQNIAYYLDYLYNGAGSGIPDPLGAINDQPPATRILDPYTVIVTGGDWNEDEVQNGSYRGPATWITEAEFPESMPSSDGTDRDRSDSKYDDARDVFTGASSTHGSSKLDYIAWQDSIATLRRAFIFNTLNLPPGAMPPELVGFQNPPLASAQASDHLPVIVDLRLPLSPDLHARPGGAEGYSGLGNVHIP